MPDGATGTSTAWFPLLTALIGFLAGAISEWFRDRRATKRDRETANATTVREREAREAVRRAQLFELRANFQRETLLELQDAVMKLSRAAGRMHHIDDMEHRKTGKWGGHLFPEDLDDAAHQANVKTLVLMVRVRDRQIREMVNTLREHATRVGLYRTENESRQALNGIVTIMDPLNERIGEVLRRLDDDEPPAST